MRHPFAFLLAALLAGCGSDGAATNDDNTRHDGARGVTQGGPLDIAEFRAVVAQGDVPSLELLDEVGFFAEHALDQPPADCGGAVCAHPMLAVAPRFGPGTWTMAFTSLNTPVDPTTRPREPLHVVLVVERSQAIDAVLGASATPLSLLTAGLDASDRLTVVAFGTDATIRASAIPVDPATSFGGLLPQPTSGGVDLYAGLAAAAGAIAALPDVQARVVLLTSGAASHGLTDPGRIEDLAAGIARGGTSFSVIGMGQDYQREVPSRIADLGAGTYAFAQSTDDLSQLLSQDGSLRMVPIATDVVLQVTPAEGYSVGQLHGVKRASVTDGVALLEMPALFVGARTGASDAAWVAVAAAEGSSSSSSRTTRAVASSAPGVPLSRSTARTSLPTAVRPSTSTRRS